MPHAQAWHRTNSYIPLEVIAKHGRARRLRPHHPGGIRRARPRQGIDVRRLRGAVARLYRRRLDRHPHRDRGRADPRRRHPGAEAQMAAQARLRRGAADGGVHRAQYRVRPRLVAHPRRARRRGLQGQRQQDLDHPSGPRRPDDAPGAHRIRRSRAIAASPCCWRKSRAAPMRIRFRRPACPAPRSRCSAIAA